MSKPANADLSPSEVVRRPNQTLAVMPKNGRITAVMRRSFIALLYFSQKDGMQEIYRRTLKELAQAAQFTSSNTKELKDHLRELQATQVEWNTSNSEESRWTISSMIAQIDIVEQKGGATIIEWALAPRVRNELLNPESYTSLTLQIYTSLRSGASIALYGICSRYKTNPSRVTNRDHWDWWRPRLTGNPEPDANNEYKYFKRDVLRPAIKEINAVADIEIELLEYKNGKRIEEIQFRISPKVSMLMEPEPVAAIESVDGELLEQIIRLGFKEADARKICSQHDATYLRKSIALVEQRAAAPNLPPVASKAALFRTAVKDGYANVIEIVPHRPAAMPPAESPEVKQQHAAFSLMAERVRQAYEAYKELSEDEQAAKREEFRLATKVSTFKTEIRRRGIVSMPVRTAFCEWYAGQLWGELASA
jgi:hypothetical protein